MKLKISDIIKATHGKLLNGDLNTVVTNISTDTRTIKKGDLFIAIKGPIFDGHDYIEDAFEKGAVCAIVERLETRDRRPETVIKVEDTITALGDIASCWRDKIDITCIAVTGSNGKSTTKEMIAAALSGNKKVIKTEGNFNNLIGLPLQLARISKDYDLAVLEMGMNAFGEIKRLTEIAKPDIGLITNVNPAHLEKLQTIENVALAKGELFETMRKDGTAVINVEDPLVVKLGKKYPGKKITFGMQDNCDVRFVKMVCEDLSKTELTLEVNGKRYELSLPVPGTHNVMNALAAIAVGVAVGVPVDSMLNGLSDFKPMKMRMEKIQLSNGVQLINDSYNANPASMKVALKTAGSAKKAGRFIAVLGDMLELGDSAHEKHFELGKNVKDNAVNKLFVAGKFAEDVKKGAGKADVFKDFNQLNEAVLKEIKSGDVVLVKGSRGMKMERVVEFLKNRVGT